MRATSGWFVILAAAGLALGGTGCGGGLGGPSLELKNGSTFSPGERIEVVFTAPAHFPHDAWVGIIPSNIEHGSEAVNDQHDLTYEYVSNRVEGMMTFSAPNRPGTFDMRMHDTDGGGSEVAYVSFTVEGQVPVDLEASLNLEGETTTYAQGDRIQVRFTAPGSYAHDAWVGIIPSNIAHGSESMNDQHDLTYQYLSSRTEGILTFSAPNRPGAFDLRMHDTDGGGSEVAYVSFTVEGQVPVDLAAHGETADQSPPTSTSDSRRVPSVGDPWEMPGFACKVVAVGPKPFSHTCQGKTTYLSHVEDRWVNHLETRNTTYTIVVDASVPSAKFAGWETLTPKDPKGGHYYLSECDRCPDCRSIIEPHATNLATAPPDVE